MRVVVERGALEGHDGVGQYRRTPRYDRATHGLRRLVILNACRHKALADCPENFVLVGNKGFEEVGRFLRLVHPPRRELSH